jgi:acetoin utilization deacetylase AcuC-like enzyme
MKVGIVYDPIYLKHDTGQHPENARRLEATIGLLEDTGLRGQLVPIKPVAATVAELSLVHSRQHIARIQEVAEDGGGWPDADTVMSPASYEAARYAAGGVIRATRAVITGEVASAFALVRPPGHHATPNYAMGFCLFNNVAIAARYAGSEYGLSRIAIIDFDVHHGNGTQDVFYDEPNVLYISTHQAPLYPGTGGIDESGGQLAPGSTINIPLPAGCGDSRYQAVFEQIVAPALRRFKPRLILVSAGYDAHWADELAMMQLSTTGFARMVAVIKEIADELCAGRLVFSLEGGYNLDALAHSVKATFGVLLGKPDIEDKLGPPPAGAGEPDIEPLVAEIREIHRLS